MFLPSSNEMRSMNFNVDHVSICKHSQESVNRLDMNSIYIYITTENTGGGGYGTLGGGRERIRLSIRPFFGQAAQSHSK